MPIVENLYRQEPLPAITQEMLFSEPGYLQTQTGRYVPICMVPVQQQSNIMTDLVGVFLKGIVGYAAVEIAKEMFTGK